MLDHEEKEGETKVKKGGGVASLQGFVGGEKKKETELAIAGTKKEK